MPSSFIASGRSAHGVRAVAALVLIVGYLDLVRGGISLAPVLLVIGYLVLVARSPCSRSS